MRRRHQVQHHLGVHRRGEDRAALFEGLPQGFGIHDVAVVGDRDGAGLAAGKHRSGVAHTRVLVAGGGVAAVANGDAACEGCEVGFGENVGDEAGAHLTLQRFAISRNDAGGLLPAVLQGVEHQVRELGGLGLAHRRRVPNPHHRTLVAEDIAVVIVGLEVEVVVVVVVVVAAHQI